MAKTKMKERPILFSSEMVRAILDGRKTQTRRIIKPQPDYVDNIHKTPNTGGKVIKCPFGQPGERLWVRETWADNIRGCPNGITYRADHCDPKGDGPANPIKWRASIFMPRWASRITLEITNIRVQRLHDILSADAEAEGVLWKEKYMNPVHAFVVLWDSINAKRGFEWDENPWVWVIEFKKLEDKFCPHCGQNWTKQGGCPCI